MCFIVIFFFMYFLNVDSRNRRERREVENYFRGVGLWRLEFYVGVKIYLVVEVFLDSGVIGLDFIKFDVGVICVDIYFGSLF